MLFYSGEETRILFDNALLMINIHEAVFSTTLGYSCGILIENWKQYKINVLQDEIDSQGTTSYYPGLRGILLFPRIVYQY